MKKIFRISTVPFSLNILLRGQLEYLNKFYEVTAISGAGKDLDEVHQREGVRIHPIEMQRQISPLKDLISLIKLYAYFKKQKPDLVHSITPKAGLLSMLAAKWAGVPVRMHTFTGLVFPYKTGMMQKLLILMDKLLCWAATDIFPEGNGVKSDLIKYKITKKYLQIIGPGNVNGIDLDFFNPEKVRNEEKLSLRESYGIKENDKVLIFVGRLVKDKGINELIAAFKSLQPFNAPSLKLLLVGPFEQDIDPLLPETLEEIKTNPQIITVGFQSDVRSYLAIADILVFPSYREGFPNVVLQALAMELPAIVTNINGCNEIIDNQKNGLIIDVKNKQQIMEAINELLQTDLLQNIKKNTRKSIMKFDRNNIWRLLSKKYYNSLNRNN